MKVLFGSVEYFERELNDYLNNEKLKHMSTSQRLDTTYSAIKDDIAHVFICSEAFREECLKNLIKAYEKVSSSLCVVI
ncbi:MAG: hypothetical protein ACQEUT_02360 [Bacillota bacterium]